MHQRGGEVTVITNFLYKHKCIYIQLYIYIYKFITGSKTVVHQQNLIQRKSSLLNIFKALMLFEIKTRNQLIN